MREVVRPTVAVFDDELPAEAEHLQVPVLCTHCRAIYDLVGVQEVARHADCDVFIAPCCGRTVDNRRFKSLPDITRLDRRKPQAGFLAQVAEDDLLFPGGVDPT